jgi:hypothetical protein
VLKKKREHFILFRYFYHLRAKIMYEHGRGLFKTKGKASSLTSKQSSIMKFQKTYSSQSGLEQGEVKHRRKVTMRVSGKEHSRDWEAHNPSYLKGRGQENHGSRPA